MAQSTVELIVDATKAVNPLKRVASETKKLEAATKKSSAAFTASGREIKTAANGMKFFTDAAGRARKVNGQFVTTAEAAAAGLNNQGKAAKGASNAFNGLSRKVAGLAAAYIGLNAAQKSFRVGVSRIESERRIEFLAKGYGEVAELQNAATKAAERFGTGQTEANRALADVFARLRPIGVELSDIVSVYNGFNTAARISGASAVESSNAFRQLSQALGSGALRGDEFNSISDQVPGILTAIAKESGVAQGKLRAFAAEGKITSDLVIRALKRIETEGAGQLKAALGGPAQAMVDFQNAAEDVQVALTQDIIPEIAESFTELAELIKGLSPLFRLVGGGISGALSAGNESIGQIRSFFRALTQPGKVSAAADIREGRMPFNFFGANELLGKDRVKELKEIADIAVRFGGRNEGPSSQQKVLIELFQKELGMFAPPGRKKDKKDLPTRPTPLTNAQKKGIATAGAMELDADRQIQLLKEESELGKQLLESDFRRADALAKINSLEGISKERRQEVIDITNEAFDAEKGSIMGAALAKDIVAVEELSQAQKDAIRPLEEQRRILEGKLAGNEEEVRLQLEVEKIMRSVKGLNRDDVEAQLMKNSALEQQVKQVEELEALYKQVGSAIESSIVNGIMGAIEGTQTLQETVSGLLKDIGKMFLQFAVRGLLQGTGLPMFQFAEGGYVSGPTPALVGEGGESEYIIPESKMRESMSRYSRGARGSSVIPKAGGSGTSGEGGGVAVAEPIDVRYTVERINSVDYVTADQFLAGMQRAADEGAKQGQQQTLKRLQMSSSTRKRLGM